MTWGNAKPLTCTAMVDGAYRCGQEPVAEWAIPLPSCNMSVRSVVCHRHDAMLKKLNLPGVSRYSLPIAEIPIEKPHLDNQVISPRPMSPSRLFAVAGMWIAFAAVIMAAIWKGWI